MAPSLSCKICDDGGFFFCLRAMSKFDGILFYFYICDRTSLIVESAKELQLRSFHVPVYALLIIVSAVTPLKKQSDKFAFFGKSIVYLNRHQTEEWERWMQVQEEMASSIYGLLLTLICR
ncbi:hypothetical protein L1987_65209 [Smallanthus sonchifolius]|uniref:Uncharacterized protein n=1 Tax=Smallanthus sonchifolius TaxID=185202 RepID=A0ACB9BTQ3_9ASTR|nr:hypothetical protein L1987_65209 [Smallanthus sonchifolius]